MSIIPISADGVQAVIADQFIAEHRMQIETSKDNKGCVLTLSPGWAVGASLAKSYTGCSEVRQKYARTTVKHWFDANSTSVTNALLSYVGAYYSDVPYFAKDGPFHELAKNVDGHPYVELESALTPACTVDGHTYEKCIDGVKLVRTRGGIVTDYSKYEEQLGDWLIRQYPTTNNLTLSGTDCEFICSAIPAASFTEDFYTSVVRSTLTHVRKMFQANVPHLQPDFMEHMSVRRSATLLKLYLITFELDIDDLYDLVGAAASPPMIGVDDSTDWPAYEIHVRGLLNASQRRIGPRRQAIGLNAAHELKINSKIVGEHKLTPKPKPAPAEEEPAQQEEANPAQDAAAPEYPINTLMRI